MHHKYSHIMHKLDNNSMHILNKVDELAKTLDTIPISDECGKIVSVVGTMIIATIKHVKIGDLCQIFDPSSDFSIDAEVVSLSDEHVKLLPFGVLSNISKKTLVRKKSASYVVAVGDFLLGCVVDGFGQIIDTNNENSNNNDADNIDNTNNISYRSVMQLAPDPLKRPLIDKQLHTGVNSIDLFMTVGRGQRLAIFAGPGMGKTTLIGMILRYSEADVVVIGLIGERGREVKEFLDLELTPEVRRKCVVVVATSAKSPVEQVKAAYVTHTVAEYFRDQGKNVIIFLDSITRFARAQREVGLSSGEPITRGGYPPSVFLSFPKLMERAGTNEHGSITAFYTVLMEGENTQNDPIADEVRSIVDGHIILSKKLVETGHFPAINVLSSLSRVADRIITGEHVQITRKARLLLSKFQELEFLIRVGEYKTGNDALADESVKKNQPLLKFLQQGIHERGNFQSKLNELTNLLR